MMRLLAAVALCLSAAPATAQVAGGSPDPVQQAFERGSLIYAYDQAAWHGTDDMLTKLESPQDKLGGWIVDGPADAAEIVFYDRSAEPRAVYIAQFRGNRLVSSRVLGSGDDASLSPQRRQMIAAGNAAADALVAARPGYCSDKPFNRVILPPAAPGSPTLVYFLTPQTDNKTIPLGGHHRVEVGVDGKVGRVRSFSKACMAMPLNPPPNEEGSQAAAMVVSHLLDPIPTEAHVFSALALRKTLFVLANDRTLWAVGGDGIRRVDRKQ